MQLIHVEAQNFASYSTLNFSFEGQGLTLISGENGVGKSTLQDVVPWVLFGITAKDGNADDIRPWGSVEPTVVTLKLSVKENMFTVTRVRGTPRQNDLFWVENNSADEIRGKDINETQVLLNQRLGCDAYTYVLSCYYNEHNAAGLFFSRAKANDRRELFESVVDLSFPHHLTEGLNESKKEAKKDCVSLETKISKTNGKLEALKSSLQIALNSSEKWKERQKEAIEDLNKKNDNFVFAKKEQIRELKERKKKFDQETVVQMNAIDAILIKLTHQRNALGAAMCEACGQNIKTVSDLQKQIDSYQRQLEEWRKKENPWEIKIITAQAAENPYLTQLQYTKDQPNPYLYQIEELKNSIDQNEKLFGEQSLQYQSLQKRLNSLVTLQDLAAKMRSEMIVNVIKQIETNTNQFLDRYFDAEIRISLEADGKDNLNVSIQNSGYECSYRQLSKGQKKLLSLCFSVAVMKASSDKSGMHYSTLFIDEALDGFSDRWKNKAYYFFESLLKHHESILVIDHSQELSLLFANKFWVDIKNNLSTIERIES